MVMDDGVVVEVDAPSKIFTNPTQARTAEFLRRVLHH
jgi:ABC-type polar amino acid transport system ATPase subunit